LGPAGVAGRNRDRYGFQLPGWGGSSLFGESGF
jgi:hypothetical protein